MSYLPPNLRSLLKGLGEVRTHYSRPTHAQVADFLETFRKFIRSLQFTKDKSELQEIMLGAAFFIRRCVMDEYSTNDETLCDPIYSAGYFYNSGSTFYTFLNEKLLITAENPLDRKTELVYLQKFYSFFQDEINLTKVHTQNASSETLLHYLEEDKINVIFIKKKLEIMLTNRLKNMHEFILALSRFIPTEAETLSGLANLSTYSAPHKDSLLKSFIKVERERSPSPAAIDKKFIEQFGKALLDLIPILYPEETESRASAFSRTNKMLMGCLWWIIKFMEEKYKLNCNHSKSLHDAACKALHIISAEDRHSFMYDKEMQKICLSAFLALIKHPNLRDLLDKYGKLHFPKNNTLDTIDARLDEIKKSVKEMKEKLSPSKETSLVEKFPATIRLSEFMKNIAIYVVSPIPVGTGALLGFLAHQTISTALMTNLIAEVVNSVGEWFLGPIGSFPGFFAVNFAGEVAFMFAGSALLFLVVKAALMLAGGLVGAIIVDIPGHGH